MSVCTVPLVSPPKRRTNTLAMAIIGLMAAITRLNWCGAVRQGPELTEALGTSVTGAATTRGSGPEDWRIASPTTSRLRSAT